MKTTYMGFRSTIQDSSAQDGLFLEPQGHLEAEPAVCSVCDLGAQDGQGVRR